MCRSIFIQVWASIHAFCRTVAGTKTHLFSTHPTYTKGWTISRSPSTGKSARPVRSHYKTISNRLLAMALIISLCRTKRWKILEAESVGLPSKWTLPQSCKVSSFKILNNKTIWNRVRLVEMDWFWADNLSKLIPYLITTSSPPMGECFKMEVQEPYRDLSNRECTVSRQH